MSSQLYNVYGHLQTRSRQPACPRAFGETAYSTTHVTRSANAASQPELTNQNRVK